jgi:hypothetical protein
MPGTRRKAAFIPPNERLFTAKPRRAAPFQFVLDAIAELPIRTRSMFGCLAVYVADKIVLILRDRLTERRDNGVWLATSPEHHESLRREFPNMRTIYLLGDKITNWQNLPVDAPDFEQSALRVCDLILARDPRIGKAPKRKRSSRA